MQGRCTTRTGVRCLRCGRASGIGVQQAARQYDTAIVKELPASTGKRGKIDGHNLTLQVVADVQNCAANLLNELDVGQVAIVLQRDANSQRHTNRG